MFERDPTVQLRARVAERDRERLVATLRARIVELRHERRARASRRRSAATLRRDAARTLATHGFTYRQIGELLGYSKSQAHEDARR